jgi:hypothetical protein
MSTPLVLWGWHPGEGRTPAQAKSALSRSLIDESQLDRVRFFWCAKAFQCRDFVLANCVYWHHARSHYLSAQDHCAGSALGHAASELRSTKPNLIAKNEE